MKKKVLIVTESISYGGLNLASVRFQQYLDQDQFECEYCVRRSHLGDLEEDILRQGIRVHHVPDSELNYLKSYRYYKKLFSENHYDIVHCHLPFFSGIVLLAARQCGVPVRVAHAHFSQPYTDTAIYSKKKQAIAVVYRKLMRVLLKHYCNAKLACSQKAGEFLYGKRTFADSGIVLNNGIETDEFRYNSVYRHALRDELQIAQDAVVLGHIGQMYSVKNQSYIIDIFAHYYQQHSNAYLLLIGDGVDREMLEEKVRSLQLEKQVFFLGLRKDANKLYQAMDCFVFPSLHEGFPLTLIEAQASMLPCVISDAVTQQVKLNDNIVFLPITVTPDVWCEQIDALLQTDRQSVSAERVYQEFDIRAVTAKLEKIYLSLLPSD
ncbi:MAG: glycosyltransferase [Eubacterium sp.]|nr:glycosyltransferase [Eubacterium sp.]